MSKFKICRRQVESFDRPFSKGRGFSGQSPESPSADGETLRTSKKFLFLLLFLLAKGEKEELYLCCRSIL
jgi:hypothetical protein